MILKFSFSRVSENGILENLLHIILHKIICKSPIKGAIESQKKEVFLYVEGSEEELSDFSTTLSNMLPISLFYTFVEVKVAKKIPNQSELMECDINIPFTHTQLFDFLDKNGKNYLNLSLKEDVGRSLEVKSELTSEDVDNAISHLKKGNHIQISTRQGVGSVGIVNETSKEFLKNRNFTIMPCDLSLVSKMAIANKKEIQALASLEKPILNLRVNLIYKNKNFLPSSWVNMQMCDSLLLFLLCKRLFESKEEFIYLLNEEISSNISLLHEQKHTTKALYVNVLENGEIVMIGDNEYISNKKIPPFKQKAHERFTTILYEYNLFDKKNICFFLSHKHDDKVMFYTQKTGLSELVSIKIPSSISQIVENIKKDENGKKLILNYEKAHKQTFEKAQNFRIPSSAPQNFYTLLGVVGIFFGYGEDLQTSAKTLLYHGKNFSGPKGPRLDVKLNEKNFINIEKFIQSGLSFRLAGVEDETLSFGYFESIAFFVSDMADRMKKELECESVSLCGDLFGFKRMLEISAKHIQPNHKIYLNRAFSLE